MILSYFLSRKTHFMTIFSNHSNSNFNAKNCASNNAKTSQIKWKFSSQMQLKINLSRPSSAFLPSLISFFLMFSSNNSILISHRCFNIWKSFPWIGNFSSSLSAFYIKLVSNILPSSNLRRRDYALAWKLHYAKNMFHIKTSSR